MATIEQALCKIIGFRPETNGIRWYSSIGFELLAKLDYLLHHTTFEGTPLPSEGPVLLIGNHISLWDPVKAYRLGQMTGDRIIRAFTRDSLLDPRIKESASILRRTGNKKDILNQAPMGIRLMIAALPSGFEAMPASRRPSKKEKTNLITRGTANFSRGLAEGMFLQLTRDKEGKLTDLRPGAQWLVEANPDIPILPMGISAPRPCKIRIGPIEISMRKPHKVRTGTMFTYRQMVINGEGGDIAKQNFTVFLGDQVANLLDPKIREDWYAVQRPLLLSPKKRP